MSAAGRLTAAEKRIAAGLTAEERAYRALGEVVRTALEAAGLAHWQPAEDREAGHAILGSAILAPLDALWAAREAESAARHD